MLKCEQTIMRITNGNQGTWLTKFLEIINSKNYKKIA